MRIRPAGCLLAFMAMAYFVTVFTTAFSNYRTLQLADDNPVFLDMLRWQAVTYFIWVPIGALVWRLFRKHGLSRAAVIRYVVSGAIIIPLHAFFAILYDVHQASPGTIDLRTLIAQRAQLDVLVYASFGTLALAADFQSRAARAASEAAAIKVALDAAKSALAQSRTSDIQPPERLMATVGSRQIVVRLAEVEWFGAAANYVAVNWADQEGLIRQTLHALEKQLNPLTFARAHRGTIVNLTMVAAAESLSDGSWKLTMASGAEIVVSRTYRNAILERLRRPAT